MKESFQPEEIKSEAKKEKSIWRTFRNMKNAAAFAALLSFAAPALSSAGEKEINLENPKENVLTIAENLKTKGREGKMGQTIVRKWISEGKDTVVVGYGNEGKPVFLITEDGDAKMRFFDKGADGSLNRVIINEEKSSAMKKTAYNDLKTFISMDNLAEEAKKALAVADMIPPEKTNVYEFGKENGEIILRGVDFEKGESEKVIGPEAKKLAERVQNLFNKKVAQHSAELAK